MAKAKRRNGSTGQVIGGILADFDQRIFRSTPPPHEMVHHARPDAPVPASDGGDLRVILPGDEPPETRRAGPDPVAEDELERE